MSGSAHKFVSVFRLDAKPILPPLMTDEKRREMRKYRDQAVRLEHQNTPYAEFRAISKPDVHEFCYRSADKAIEDSYVLLTKLVLNDKDRTSEIAERTKKLKKSETIIFDNITNAVIVPLTTDDVTTAIPAINIDPPTPLSRGSFAESIEINDFEINSEYTTASLPATPPKRSATSPALNQLSQMENKTSLFDHIEPKEQPTLIRSNSFTLKTPSRALIEHMRQQELQQQQKRYSTTPYVARDTVESKAKRQQKVNMNERTNNLADMKNKRSPYEQRFDTKPKLARNLKKTVVNKKDSTSSPARVMHFQRKVKTVAADGNSLQQNAVFTYDVKAENTQKFLQLLAEQQQEQNRMLEVFALQRNQLLQELERQNSTEKSLNIKTIQSLQLSPQVATKKSPPPSRKTKIHDHSRRKLFSDHCSSSTPLNSVGKMCSFAFEPKKRVSTKNYLHEFN